MLISTKNCGQYHLSDQVWLVKEFYIQISQTHSWVVSSSSSSSSSITRILLECHWVKITQEHFSNSKYKTKSGEGNWQKLR